jgi:hypothetical protein
MVIWYVLLVLLAGSTVASTPIIFDSAEVNRRVSDFILTTYVAKIDSTRQVPESFSLIMLDSTIWHDTTFYALAFTYADYGYGNRTTESIVATISRCDSTFCDQGVSYHGAVDGASFVAYDSALFLEITTVYGATGWHTCSYALREVAPHRTRVIFNHSLTESALVSGTYIDNSYIRVLPSATGKPDTAAVLVTHHAFDWRTGQLVEARHELEVFRLDPVNDTNHRISIQPSDSADWFKWYRLIQQPIRFEKRLCDTLPRQVKHKDEWE